MSKKENKETKIANKQAMSTVKQLIDEKENSQKKFLFRSWIPKNSQLKSPMRIYIENSEDEAYVFKHNDKLIISTHTTNQQLQIENFLLEHDIDLNLFSNLSQLENQLNDNGLLIKPAPHKTIKKASRKKSSPQQLSKLKKGDKLIVSHDNKKLIITITHIEVEKGVPTINFSSSGDQSLQLSTEIKAKKTHKRTNKIQGSNKGRGWSKGQSGIKK